MTESIADWLSKAMVMLPEEMLYILQVAWRMSRLPETPASPLR